MFEPYDPGSEDAYLEDGWDEEDAEESLALDTHVPFAPHAFAGSGDTHIPRLEADPETVAARPAHSKDSGRRVRVRPMTDALVKHFPNVVTILLTRADGKQVLLVRK